MTQPDRGVGYVFTQDDFWDQFGSAQRYFVVWMNMNENPYQSPESPVDSTALPTNRGDWQVSFGYALLAIYVFAAFKIAHITSSTGRFDKIVALQYFVWLTPFLVLIPWLSLKALGKSNPTNIRFSSAALLFSFIVCSGLIFMMIDLA